MKNVRVRASAEEIAKSLKDHSHVSFSQMHNDETARSVCAFLLAALRHYRHLGVPIAQVMTDNGSACESRRFARPLRRLGIRQFKTRPYMPRTDGKAERLIQTLP
jgi:transposase InsO family protein